MPDRGQVWSDSLRAMGVRATTDSAQLRPAGCERGDEPPPPDRACGRDGGGTAVRGDAAGRLFGRLSVLPTLLVMAWLLAGLPPLLLGWFTPAGMLVVSVPLAVVLLVLGLRWVPGRSQTALPPRKPEQARTPWWTVAGVVAVAVAFGVDQMIYHSQFIIVTRDPGSYIQFANWIAHHGSLPIPQDRAAFGGTHHVLGFVSFAYYSVGGAVVPQFMAGLPMILASGFWIGGVTAAAAMGPVLGACAVLTFGGLVARLAGPRWAPLAALVLALSLPEQFTSRSTYSEPLAQILFLGGLCLVIDSLNADGIGARVIAGLAGLALGLTLLVRIDGANDILPVVPCCGLLLLGRRRQGLPFLCGVVAGGVYGIVDGLVLSRPYLAITKGSLVPLALVAGVLIIATLLAMALFWNKGIPRVGGKSGVGEGGVGGESGVGEGGVVGESRGRGQWLPDAVAVLAVLVVIGFALRPYVQTVRVRSSRFFEGIIASYQRADHLPVAPDRLYYEISLHWVFWYIGVPAVVFGTLAAALLSRRCVRGLAPAWTLPLMVFAWAIVTTLYRPSITPDQPWASRRLVPAVLPGFILLAVWGSSWLTGRIRQAGVGRVVYTGLAALCVAALVLPAAMTTFGLGVKPGGPVGIRLTADGLANKITYRGEIPAVDGLCAAIPRDASVVFIQHGQGGVADQLSQVVRGMCGVPVARMSPAPPGTMQQVLRGIEQAGRRPVLLAGISGQLTPYGGQIRQIMRLRSTKDGTALTVPPRHTRPLIINVWMSEPAP